MIRLILITFFMSASAFGGTHIVEIEAMKFHPETLTVKSGDTITWLNKDFFPHTATANKVFNSRSIPATKSWSYKAKSPGTFNYKCLFHPTMKGTLIIQ